jgi:hypothetical protein
MASDPSRYSVTPLSSADFSLMVGGPLFQLWRRSHLADDALTLVPRRIVAAVAITWAPLLVLCAVQGSLIGSGRSMPFLEDADCHLRFLVSLPLLIA